MTEARRRASPKVTIDAPPPNYRPCVGIVLINKAGLVFIGERRGVNGDSWQMPQGGIDDGEQPLAAAKRELLEETGVEQIEFLAECDQWHCYDIPEAWRPGHWKGRYAGQCQRWFAFRFSGEDSHIDLDAYEPEFSLWRWAKPEEVVTLVVSFKRDIYRAVINEFRPFLAQD